MNKTWLLLDCNYLMHRAWHALGGQALSYEDSPTGALFGFFRDVKDFADLFSTEHFCFCFDQGKSLRKKIFPGYKNRPTKEAERPARELLCQQIDRLRREYLPEMGYANVFSADGYEADDVIASLCRHLPTTDEIIIISADKDLYQCLAAGITIYKPQSKSGMTKADLKEQFGVYPKDWAFVKAAAGCASDTIPGIKGVGEINAAKYVLGTLKPESKALQAIEANAKLIERNLKLVKLPFPKTPRFQTRLDTTSPRTWNAVLRRLGMTTLMKGLGV